MRPDPEFRPPAGGFGQSPHSASFGPQIGPRRDRRSIIGVVSVGVLVLCSFGAFAGYGLFKRHRAERRAEAFNNIGHIGKDLLIAYEINGDLCPTAAPVPAHIEMVQGQLYPSTGRDWADDPGWKCLGFSVDRPQAYQYRYERTGDVFVISAETDLDGDGVVSRLQTAGRLRASSAGRRAKTFEIDPAIVETNPGE